MKTSYLKNPLVRSMFVIFQLRSLFTIFGVNEKIIRERWKEIMVFYVELFATQFVVSICFSILLSHMGMYSRFLV